MPNRLFLAVVLALATVFTFSADAQIPHLVTDLNTTMTTPSSSSPTSFRAVGDTVYFFAGTDNEGRELWKYSGGTVSLVLDIFPGFTSSQSLSPAEILSDIGGGVLLFRALTNSAGNELWRTDGTAAGTKMVKDINAFGGSGSAGPRAVLNGRLFFVADDGLHGSEPWVSDGTEAGTQMVRNLNDTGTSSNIVEMIALGDRMLIFTNNAVWTTDGTSANTTRLTPLSAPRGFARVGSAVYFTSNSFDSGRELWMTDGTAAGTKQFIETAPGQASGVPSSSMLMAIGSTLYFTAAADATGADLWKSDGTVAGTQFVTTLTTSGEETWIGNRDPLPNGVFTFLKSGSIWRSDGTAAGTFLLDQTAFDTFSSRTAFGQAFYFRANGNARELWSTDGTARTFVQSFAAAGELAFTGGKLFLSAFDAMHGGEPWVSEAGTTATTHLLANINPDRNASSFPGSVTAANHLVIFSAIDGSTTGDVFRSDGTAGGTFRLTSFNDTFPLSPIIGWHDRAWFSHGQAELWRSDGTVAGTAMLKDFQPEFVGGTFTNFFGGSRHLFFNGGEAIWRTDGTLAGTAILGTELPASLRPKQALMFTELAGRVYFIGTTDAVTGIWRTDGEAGTTQRILTSSFGLGNLVAAAGTLFFTLGTDETGSELWRSDGTFGGESLVRDIAPGPASGLSTETQATPGGRYLYFVADDGTHGVELWRSDGTAAGTILLKDIIEGSASSQPTHFVAAGSLLYFTAVDTAHGEELWRTDGTPEGTVLVADLRPGSDASSPEALTFASGTLWFRADDGTSGSELWRLDGNTPVLAADLSPGSGSSTPEEIVESDQQLFFRADTAEIGTELWALTLTNSVVSIGDVRVVEGTGGTRTMRFTVTRSGNTTGAGSVVFATSNGSTSADDFTAAAGTLSFAAGQVSRFIDVSVNADAIVEPYESLFVTLSSPAGVVLGRSVGMGIIDDDDHSADLSIVGVPSLSGRRFQITNAGPSAASNMRVRFSESPRNFGTIVVKAGDDVACSASQVPLICTLAGLQAGATVEVSFEYTTSTGFVDAAAPPGSMVTADVVAAETDPNLANNLARNLITPDGTLTMPAFLTSGTSAAAIGKAVSAGTMTMTTSSPNVFATPASQTVAQSGLATFTLTSGAATGRVKVTLQQPNKSASLMADVVAPGSTAKLDVAMIVAGSQVTFGEPGMVSVEIAARRHDGTRPTGLVSLLDESSNVVAQQSLDSSAKTVFLRNDAQPGSTAYFARYEGDANFHPLTGPMVSVTVNSVPTEIQSVLPPLMCAGTTHQVTILVTNTATNTVPAGSVQVTVQSNGVAVGAPMTLALTPTGTPGQSRAVFSRQFQTGETSLFVEYAANGGFARSRDFPQFECRACAALNVNATATSPATIAVTWSPVAGAHHYQVLRYTTRTAVQAFTTTTALNATDTGRSANRAYLYSVIAFDAADAILGYGALDVATTLMFNDDPLVVKTTPVRAMHLQQLRVGANALRFFGTGADATAVTPVAIGSAIRASDLNALRSDLNSLRLGLGVPALTFTDPTLTTSTKIKAVHFDELRRAVK